MIACETNRHLSNLLLRTVTVMFVLVGGGEASAEPGSLTVESLRQSDPANLSAYTLRVTIEEPANAMLWGQGIGRYACVLTCGGAGLAALCEAEQLPNPIYRPPDSPSYRAYDYDPEGNLVVHMRSKWLTLSTANANDSYREGRSFFVSPEGVVTKTGVSRSLHRYAPDDLWGWGLSKLRRVWWALGQGLSGDFEHIVSTSELAGLERAEIRSKSEGRWPGVWRADFEAFPTPLIRAASFISNARSDVSVEVTTKGARQFGPFTLAEEGVVRFPHPHDPFETRVVLKHFEPRFDEELFQQVKETLERVRADETVKVLDHPWGPPTPPPDTIHPPAPGSDQ